MSESRLPDGVRQALLRLAADSIAHGLRTGRMFQTEVSAHPPELREPRGTFVTLHLDGGLQGCIGSLRPIRPLALDVCRNAHAAAFEDPRGRALNESHLAALDIHISILSIAQPMQFASEEDVLSQLRPGIDGVTVEEQGRRGTLLPSVWESLPEAREFLAHVKVKAGLPKDYWSPALKVERYTTESFGNRT